MFISTTFVMSPCVGSRSFAAFAIFSSGRIDISECLHLSLPLTAPNENAAFTFGIMQMRESLLPTRFETDQWPRVTFKSPKEWFSENRQRFWDSRCRLPQIVFPIASCGRTSSDIPCPDSANKQGSDAGYETARRQPASSYCFISVYLFFRLVYHSSV